MRDVTGAPRRALRAALPPASMVSSPLSATQKAMHAWPAAGKGWKGSVTAGSGGACSAGGCCWGTHRCRGGTVCEVQGVGGARQRDSQLLWRRSQAASDSAAAVLGSGRRASTSVNQRWEARRRAGHVAARLSLQAAARGTCAATLQLVSRPQLTALPCSRPCCLRHTPARSLLTCLPVAAARQ